ncbi:unnamed protein product [Soboliphyme baturini]|uniref:Pre-mRNA-splicing factor 18 n=1 Tax=Soboliphyme baturini TaxID=241478 RepID=A0A183J7R0_9BILA|nr:unnamed protein product [Soboliphyme baturini]
MVKVDQEYLNEIIHGESEEQKKHDVKVDDDCITLKEITEMAEHLEKGDVAKDCLLVSSFLNLIIQKWGKQLNSRPEEEKRSPQGKFTSATFTQTMEYINPLLRQLKAKSVASDILEHLVNIVLCLLERDYVQANNHYMEMAIGNAPWPVGVTASGIHKRPGSEKLYVRNVAHVLNDEVQRKYIQV